jgi:hypothetical protein
MGKSDIDSPGPSPSARALALWEAVLAAERARREAWLALFEDRSQLAPVLRRGLHDPGSRAVALEVASKLKPSELQELLPELLDLATYVHGLTRRAREVIMILPRDWLANSIERAAERVIEYGEEEQFRLLHAIYTDIDRALAKNLAQRALSHPDEDVREAGREFLSDFQKGA